MKCPLPVLLTIWILSVSCARESVIPKETMVDIYHDMFLLDQNILRHCTNYRIQDSLLIYEPIFNRYGYTFDDYTRSVNFYIDRPDKFSKVFEDVKHRYELRIKTIDDSLAMVNRKSFRWKLTDSVRALGADSSVTTLLYRCLDMMFFRKDTSYLKEYPMPDSLSMTAWKRHVFELYSGNPFRDEIFEGRLSPALQDTSSAAKPAAGQNISAGAVHRKQKDFRHGRRLRTD